MQWLSVCALAVMVAAAGCSTGGESVSESVASDVELLRGQVDRLEEELASAEAANRDLTVHLEEASAAAEVVADDAEAGVQCLERLARCEELPSPPDDEEWPPPSPDVWFPPRSGFVTNEPSITVVVFAPESATVTVNEAVAEPSSDRWAGGNRLFTAAVPLREGANTVGVVVDAETTLLDVVYDAGLVRRYGRVLDSRGTVLPAGSTERGVQPGCGFGEENACVLYELGVDFGEIDLEPEYGQGDFEPGQVVVEFKRLTPSTIAPITTHAGTELLLEGSEMIWEFFSHGETTHFDVWNFLLDADAIVQIEGTVPLGD